jgi:hypothetical protein
MDVQRGGECEREADELRQRILDREWVKNAHLFASIIPDFGSKAIGLG